MSALLELQRPKYGSQSWPEFITFAFSHKLPIKAQLKFANALLPNAQRARKISVEYDFNQGQLSNTYFNATGGTSQKQTQLKKVAFYKAPTAITCPPEDQLLVSIGSYIVPVTVTAIAGAFVGKFIGRRFIKNSSDSIMWCLTGRSAARWKGAVVGGGVGALLSFVDFTERKIIARVGLGWVCGEPISRPPPRDVY